MRRRVWVDPTSPAAKAAAVLLGDAFDLEVLPEVPITGPGVVLTGADGAERLPGDDARVRVIGLVDAADAGPYPPSWHLLLPVGASGPVLSRAVLNAFGHLDAAAALTRLDRELLELNEIGIRLSSERDPHVLLDVILSKAREITLSDAGSLYLVVETEDGTAQLRFALAQNDSADLPFRASTLPLTRDSAAGYVALSGEVVALDDAYALPPDAPFKINRWFDAQAGYRTKSMLVVPMRTPQGETIGVLQLINCKPARETVLRSVADAERLVVPFSPHHRRLVGSLASQAAVALSNSRLYESIRQLFEGFVKASVTAIESRDPTTSGHSFRVANLTVDLGRVVDRVATGPYANLHFSRDEIMELGYAALLHDFGKVGVREQVLVKAKKLHAVELERIRSRVELLKRSAELRYAHRKIEHLLETGPHDWEAQSRRLDAELAELLARLDDSFSRVVVANEPTVLPGVLREDLEQLTVPTFEDHHGDRHGVITPDEAEILAIARGSLTADEYRQLQSHVVHTYQFLAQIPWTREFRRIPEIARLHHEKLDGSGYPDGVTGEAIPVQSKMMTIADMYDALVAGDRPYKTAVPIETALDILQHERRLGRIDSVLLDLFIEARVYASPQEDSPDQ